MLTRLAIKLAAPLPKIEHFDRFLFIGPHPDDIEIGAGATAAKLAAMGKQVCFLICTDGLFGDGNTELRGDPLAAERKQEALRSAAALGVTDVRFLELSDGGMYALEELRMGIARAASDFKPQVIFAPDPCVNSECHADHLNVGEAVRRLVCFLSNKSIMAEYHMPNVSVQALAYYMTGRPNQFVGTRGFLSKQFSAIFDCHLTQFPANCGEAKSIRLYLQLRSIEFGLRSLKGRAEGFRVLGPTQMHCLPEAD